MDTPTNTEPITREESARRLLLLAEFLETKVPERMFSYASWAGGDDKAPDVLAAFAKEGKVPECACKTNACALGWAASMPEFQKEGLCLAKPYDHGAWNVHDTVTGKFWTEAALRIFGLEKNEADFLFLPHHDIEGNEWCDDSNSDYDWDAAQEYGYSPSDNAYAKTVAQHIRKFVAEYRQEEE